MTSIKISLEKPGLEAALAHIRQQQDLPHSYAEVGFSKQNTPVQGFDNDKNSIFLGSGENTWETGKEAIRQWRMFPGTWACIAPEQAPLQPGTTVAMIARVMGIWWLNACRIVYVLDEPNRFGFAYGTLPGHVEKGEEIFMVERDEAGQVHYVIQAFSRPRFWMARLAYPLARAYQRKFVRDSKASMQQFVKNQQP